MPKYGKFPAPLKGYPCTFEFDTDEEAAAAFKVFNKLRAKAVKIAQKEFERDFKQFEKGFGNNSTVDDRERRKKLKCSLCPPNRHENAKRKPKHGVKKPKRKKR